MKRKLWIVLTAAVLLAVLWCGIAMADSSGTCGENLTWILTDDDGVLTISGTGAMTDFSSDEPAPWLVIEDHDCISSIVITEGVTCIGSRAFYNIYSATSVAIPSSVTSIGRSAFTACGLAEVTIPNSVTRIGEGAFYACTEMTEVTISSNLTEIEDYVFQSCVSLTDVSIPDCVTKIGDYAFSDCEGLKSITIPDSVTSIGENAFSDCFVLNGVKIPGSITSIGDYAFRGCTSLTNVIIHNSEIVIGEGAFSFCASTVYLHGYIGSTTETYANNYSGVEFVPIAEMNTPDFVLPAGLTAIEDEAFWGVKATVVYIPDTVTSLGSKAFANCTNLRQIRIPASVTVIPPDLFYGLTSAQIKSITVFSAPGSAAETYANGKGMKFEVE